MNAPKLARPPQSTFSDLRILSLLLLLLGITRCTFIVSLPLPICTLASPWAELDVGP
jgi:hypothetical protein